MFQIFFSKGNAGLFSKYTLYWQEDNEWNAILIRAEEKWGQRRIYLSSRKIKTFKSIILKMIF